MTTEQLRLKNPETKQWTDEKCQQYCRALEVMTNVFIEYARQHPLLHSQLCKRDIDTYAN
jgi:hypothetical protein